MQALEKLDHSTLHTSASVVSQVGFQHFNMSNDTRLTMEARKAHRFVAANCEEIARKILRLTGAEESDVTSMLYQIGDQVREFNEARAKGTVLQAAPEGIKQ